MDTQITLPVFNAFHYTATTEPTRHVHATNLAPEVLAAASHTVTSALNTLHNAFGDTAPLSDSEYIEYGGCELTTAYDYEGMEATLHTIETLLGIDPEWTLDNGELESVFTEYRAIAAEQGHADTPLAQILLLQAV